VLSVYVLAAFVGAGVLLGALIILEWPRLFLNRHGVTELAEALSAADRAPLTSGRSPRSRTPSEAGAGLPEILRAAARALDASLILIDARRPWLAVATRSPRRRAIADAAAPTMSPRLELRVAETPVGQLRMRTREGTPDGAVLRLVTTLIASEVERIRAPERASEAAATGFQRAVLARQSTIARTSSPAGKELGTDLQCRRRRWPWSAPMPAVRPRTTGAGASWP